MLILESPRRNRTPRSTSPEKRTEEQSPKRNPLKEGGDPFHPLKLVLYRNGDRETSAMVAVSTWDELLNSATAKLQLNSGKLLFSQNNKTEISRRLF